IDERADQWRSQGWSRPSSTARAGDSAASGVPPAAPLGSTAASAGAMGATSSRPVGGTVGTSGKQYAPNETGDLDTNKTGDLGTGERNAGDLHAGETRRIPVIEEELRVGKRVVGRRGLRVYTRMVEEPV